MVEVTSKPTDISKIQDILNAINTSNDSDKNVMKVDYAKGSNLESNILALKGIAIQQAGYLKKMVEYQDKMLSTARTDSVSSAATDDNTVPDETPKPKSDGTLKAMASGAAESLIGPLGPLLIDLVLGSIKFVFKGIFSGIKGLSSLLGGAALSVASGIKSVGGKLVNSIKGLVTSLAAGASSLAAKGAKIIIGGLTSLVAGAKTVTGNIVQGAGSLLSTGVKTVGNVAQSAVNNLIRANFTGQSTSTDFGLGRKPPLLLQNPLNDNFNLGNKPRLLLREEMRVPPKSTLQLTEQMRVKPTMMQKIGGLARLGQFVGGRLLPAALAVQGLMTADANLNQQMDTIQQERGVTKEEAFKIAREENSKALNDKLLNMPILGPLLKTFEQSGKDFRSWLNSSDKSNVAAAPNRMTAFRMAMEPTTVPEEPIAPPQAAPIVIAPPAAPASTMMNSNNQQTTIINQTKDVSASLYSQMLGNAI